MQTQTQTPTSRHTDRHAIVDTQVKAHTSRHTSEGTYRQTQASSETHIHTPKAPVIRSLRLFVYIFY